MTIKRNTRRVMAVAAVTVALGACDFISPVDTNPNVVPSANVTVDQLFMGVQVNTFFIGTGGLSRIAAIWTRQMSGTDRQFVSFNNYQITENDFDDEMDALYTGGGIIDLRRAIQAAEDAGRIRYAGILKVHEAFMVGTIASFYGDIPYSTAGVPGTVPTVDDQAAVYAALQTLLDDAITDLGGGGTGPGAWDLSFAGNTARWIAVANTLKARFHMHWAEVDGTRYATARTAAQAGITSAAGNWNAQYSTAATENNLWYQFERDRSGYVSSGEFLVPLMIANADPRIGFYFDDAPTPIAEESTLSPTGFGAQDFDQPMVTCSENYFIIAEAELMDGSPDEAAARAAARSAAACQEAQWGLAADALGSTTGFAQTGAALFDEIMEQKYIAQFLNPDAYNDYKRTCRPVLSNATNMPGRLYYSINERQANPNIALPGQDPNDTYNDNDPNPCP